MPTTNNKQQQKKTKKSKPIVLLLPLSSSANVKNTFLSSSLHAFHAALTNRAMSPKAASGFASLISFRLARGIKKSFSSKKESMVSTDQQPATSNQQPATKKKEGV